MKNLHRSPRIEHLKKEAKSLLKSFKAGSPDSFRIVRNLKQYADLQDDELAAKQLQLNQVQYALALEYGFESWAKMENHVKSLAEFPDASPSEESPVCPQIDWVLPGKPSWHPGWMNGYVRGIELILQREGMSIDYDTLMGDIGQAFIMQGEVRSSNLVRGNVDVGWWPLELLGFMRLNFVEDVTGIEIIDVIANLEEVNNDPNRVFLEKFEPPIRSSLDNGIPCIAVRIDDAEFIITGCDRNRYPLIGACTNTNEGEEKVDRIKASVPPHALILFGKEKGRVSRLKADKAALDFAVELHFDRILDDDVRPAEQFNLRHFLDYQGSWRTGLQSFEAWVSELEKPDYSGAHYWHANVKGFLINNRNTAIRYLEKMSGRHTGRIAIFLSNACGFYKTVVDIASNLDVSKPAIRGIDGRQKMAVGIREIVNAESKAVELLEKAAAEM